MVIEPGHDSILVREIVLHPDLAQDINRRQAAEVRRCLSAIHGVQQGGTIGPDGFSQRLLLGGTLRQAIMLKARPVALKPLAVGMTA